MSFARVRPAAPLSVGVSLGERPTRPMIAIGQGQIIEDVDEIDLREYQVEGARWLRSRRRALLADDPGLGKTAQVLRALLSRSRTVVVCPAHLRRVWESECRRWRPDLTPRAREGLVEPRAGEVVIVSYDSLPQRTPAAQTIAPSLNLSGCTLVLDEGHYAKNYRALRTKKVRMLGRRCARVWTLTGTPMLGKPQDLWGVLGSAGLDREAYGSWEGFCRAFGAKKKRVSRTQWVTEFGDPTGEAGELLRKVMLRRKRDDVLTELPPARYSRIVVDAPEDLRPMLDQALGAWDSWGDPTELPPFEVLSAALAALARSRIDSAVSHVRDALEGSEDAIVVFSAHREPIEAIARTFGCEPLTGDLSADSRAESARRFQEGEGRVLAGTIDAIGTGLTLTRASRCVFVDEDYTPGKNAQARDRLLRIGQRSSVLVEVLSSDHPLDARRAQILERKTRHIDAVVG